MIAPMNHAGGITCTIAPVGHAVDVTCTPAPVIHAEGTTCTFAPMSHAEGTTCTFAPMSHAVVVTCTHEPCRGRHLHLCTCELCRISASDSRMGLRALGRVKSGSMDLPDTRVSQTPLPLKAHTLSNALKTMVQALHSWDSPRNVVLTVRVSSSAIWLSAQA
ncbi:hypothetical protein P7K49_007294 [Saguinus oedipus]|uniref:Uncharacterized protein n=1 Tax=Saguinus oedipus TaxID=9490 RepID=A0ABQ9VUG0_SAGOE|nr:hypothetical protein P7K49_007294 [Saguinus oedipus]